MSDNNLRFITTKYGFYYEGDTVNDLIRALKSLPDIGDGDRIIIELVLYLTISIEYRDGRYHGEIRYKDEGQWEVSRTMEDYETLSVLLSYLSYYIKTIKEDTLFGKEVT